MKIVARTRIFARELSPRRQLLVYAMSFAADEDLAMVLPIPWARSDRDDAVRFVDMSSAPGFFDALDTLFPWIQPQGPLVRGPAPAALRSKLVVHDVGAFEASFVPSIADFDRLDARFSIAPAIWQSLPDYREFGFCVFKLRAQSTANATPVHPMAFEFDRATVGELFFPTVHIHDGTVHPDAKFDHTLYVNCERPPTDWDAPLLPLSIVPAPVAAHLDTRKALARKHVFGMHPNRDIVVRTNVP